MEISYTAIIGEDQARITRAFVFYEGDPSSYTPFDEVHLLMNLATRLLALVEQSNRKMARRVATAFAELKPATIVGLALIDGQLRDVSELQSGRLVARLHSDRDFELETAGFGNGDDQFRAVLLAVPALAAHIYRRFRGSDEVPLLVYAGVQGIGRAWLEGKVAGGFATAFTQNLYNSFVRDASKETHEAIGQVMRTFAEAEREVVKRIDNAEDSTDAFDRQLAMLAWLANERVITEAE